MYVHVVSFKIKEGENHTFVEIQKFEESTQGKPAGLDHFHIFKDRNDEHRYFLVEYWKDKASKDALENTEEHKHFHELRNLAIERKYESYECDVIV